MPVRPTRRRYLGFIVASGQRHTAQEVVHAVRREVLHLYGVHGLSLISPFLIDFDEERQGGILRCSHLQLRQMRASLAHIASIGGAAASIQVKAVSGTLRALRSRMAEGPG